MRGSVGQRAVVVGERALLEASSGSGAAGVADVAGGSGGWQWGTGDCGGGGRLATAGSSGLIFMH